MPKKTLEVNTSERLSPKALEVKGFIQDKVKNKIFVVHFTKANGEHRRMRAQYGVQVGVKGTGAPSPDHIIKVYDKDEKNEHKKFKSITLENVISIDCGSLHWDDGSRPLL